MQKSGTKPPKAKCMRGTSQVQAMCLGGASQVHAWYMRGTKRPQARPKLEKSKMADGKCQRASHPKVWGKGRVGGVGPELPGSPAESLWESKAVTRLRKRH
jgi:hypothetical protein